MNGDDTTRNHRVEPDMRLCGRKRPEPVNGRRYGAYADFEVVLGGQAWEAVLARCRAGIGWIVDGVLRRGFERGFAAEFASRKMGWMDVRAEVRILQRPDAADAAGDGAPG
jgi:hypothetical protein